MSGRTFKRLGSLAEAEAAQRSRNAQEKRLRAAMTSSGWYRVLGGLKSLLPDRSAGATLQNVRKDASAVFLFNNFFDSTVLEKIKQAATPMGSRGPSSYGAASILEYFAIRIHVQVNALAQRRGDGVNQVRNAVEAARAHFQQLLATAPDGVDKAKPMPYKRFSKLHAHARITPDIARDELSPRFAHFIAPGQWVTLDEKMKKFLGASPCFRYVIGKTEPKGMWTSEVCVLMDESSHPYCVGLYPFMSGKFSSVEMNPGEVCKFAISTLKPFPPKQRPIIVSDSYYMCADGRSVLLNAKISFHVSVRADRIPHDLVEYLQRYVRCPGQWCAVFNRLTHETIVHFWDPNPDIGKKFLHSNILQPIKTRPPQGIIPGREIYNKTFSACDDFNEVLKDKTWPFRPANYLMCLDDVYFTVALINIVEIRALQAGKCLSWKTEMNKLADDLFLASRGSMQTWAAITFTPPATGDGSECGDETLSDAVELPEEVPEYLEKLCMEEGLDSGGVKKRRRRLGSTAAEES